MSQKENWRHIIQFMPKQISPQELAAIVAIVAEHPDGVRIDAIRDGLEFELPPRTLQRRLERLIEQERLTGEGGGKGRRYRLTAVTGLANVNLVLGMTAHGEVYPGLSADAEDIKAYVRMPIQSRKPVGYERNFIDAYRPNETFYLPHESRQLLLEMGGSLQVLQPAGTYVRTIYNRLLIDLTWNSSRLEGNTYSLLETERLLELGEVAEGKDAREAQMILNHKVAIELIVEQSSETGLNRHTILNLHALLSDNLLPNSLACGRLRAIPVAIGGTVYHSLEVPQLIEECFLQVLEKAAAIENPFEQAFFVMVHLSYLQAFEDVNKRVSRLAANIPLIRENLSPLSFVDVPDRAYIDGILGVYELNRVELLRDVFVWAYKRSCARYSAVRQSLGEPDPFRLRHRALLAEAIGAVVRGLMDKKTATRYIRQCAAAGVSQADTARFIELVETELMDLHEGNMVRYRLRPGEFHEWREGWQ